MPNEIKVVACQMQVIPGNPAQNTKTILHEISLAREHSADLIIFPEMAVPGYLLGDEWENESFVKDAFLYNNDIIAASRQLVVVWGNVDLDETRTGEDGRSRKYNTAFVAQDGRLIGKVHKTLMPKYREFDDERYFYSLRKEAQDKQCALQDLLKPVEITINQQIRKVGICLCEDMWSDDYTLDPVKTLLDQQAEFIINISCSPWTWRKNDKRHRVVKDRLKTRPVPLVYVNNVGTQNNGKNIFLFDGNSTIYNPDGSLAKVAEDYRACALSFSLFSEKNTYQPPALSSEKDNLSLYNALIYGLKDFYSRIGATKTVIGVSGGIDSSLSATLIALATGPDNVYAVNMPTRFNSETTKTAARTLAENLGVHYAVVPVQHSYDYTITQIHEACFTKMDASGRVTKPELSGLNKENIQARDRGSRILAGIASALGAIFINNGNKTETALGYSTLYGDVNGAIAPLADLYKTEVYELGKFINRYHKKELIPANVFDIPASAELSDEHKIDEGKGDPIIYPYHDQLMKAFIEFRMDPEDILKLYQLDSLADRLNVDPQLLLHHFPTPASFIDDLEHKWQLFKVNYFKRIQSPPIIAVSKRAFGFDLRESQNGVYYTRKYQQIKQQLLQ